MPSEISYPFAISRVRAIESNLLSANTWTRLWEAPLKDCYQLLSDVGYGSGAEDREDIDQLTQESIREAREFIAEISPEPEWTNLFVYQVDGHNIKAILKGLIERIDVEDYLIPGGTVPLEILKADFEHDTFEELPLKLREAVMNFDPEDKPDVLSAKIDSSVYAQIFFVLQMKKFKNQLLEEYFTTVVDFTNILSVIRGIKLGWDSSKVEIFLLNHGSISKSLLLEALEAGSHEQVVNLLATGQYSTQIRKILERYFANNNIIEAETSFNQISFSIIHNDYTNSTGIAPIVNYLLQKEKEARALRLLFAYKRLNREVSLEELGVL